MQSKKDLYQIGEVARLFHLSISLLRHYDKTGLVTPEYTDPDTGYRYYSLRQFECLNTIRYLRALDMPLEEIADFLHNRDTGRIQELLSKQLVQVHKKQQELAVIEHQIKNRLNQIQGALSAHPGEIFLEKKAPLKLACMKKQLNPENYLDLEYSIREMEQGNSPASIFLGKVGVGLFYESLKAHRFKPYDFVFIILEEDDPIKGQVIHIPEITWAVIRFHGSHEQAPGFYEKLLSYFIFLLTAILTEILSINIYIQIYNHFFHQPAYARKLCSGNDSHRLWSYP